MAEPLTAEARDELVRRAYARQRARYPGRQGPRISPEQFAELSEEFDVALAEYFDRLPRVAMSACPLCGRVLHRAIDPWGVDGPWWATSLPCKYDEPATCEHFQVLLGAVRVPTEATPAHMLLESRPGPEVPYVVPRLLRMPGMGAVVGELRLERGLVAYPVAYFSETSHHPVELHQPWCRAFLWFGEKLDQWTVANDRWDFELEPYVAAETLRWVRLDAGESPPRVRRASEGEACPFVGLAGERRPQWFWNGGRDTVDPPDGSPVNPF